MMPSNSDINRDNLVFRLSLLTRRCRQIIDNEFQDAGLTEATWRPLLHLHVLGNQSKQKDLAASVGIEGATLVRLIDTLVDKGLIQRTEDSSDRRKNLISLTEEGRSTVERLRKIIDPLQEQLLSDFSDKDIATIGKFILTLESKVRNFWQELRR
ncbi:MAG: MarR family transcriptional regulator [Chlorobiaceae bacterium]|nr:MarR family transcriptional regulator [Chlorobiaceae bacterium]